MNQEQLQQKIAEFYAKLSPKMQEMFSKMEWLEKLRGISLKYNLTENQIQTLGTETSLVMLGIIHPEEYEQTLMTELAVPRPIGLNILDDINLQILKDWKEDLSTTYTSNAKDLADKEYGNGKTIDERFANLPKDVQDAIASSPYQNALLEIGKKNNLNMDKMGILDNITTKMMLGVVHPEEYSLKISSALGISKENGDMIATDVNEKILKNIRNSLIAHTEKVQKEEQPEPIVPLPPYKKPEAPKEVLKETGPIITPVSDYKDIVIPMPPQMLPVAENNNGVFQNAGIEIENKVEQEPAKSMTEEMVKKDEQTLSMSGVNVVEEKVFVNAPVISTQAQEIADIENPPTVLSSMIGNKMKNITINANSISKPNTTTFNIPTAGSGAPNSGDQYREKI